MKDTPESKLPDLLKLCRDKSIGVVLHNTHDPGSEWTATVMLDATLMRGKGSTAAGALAVALEQIL